MIHNVAMKSQECKQKLFIWYIVLMGVHRALVYSIVDCTLRGDIFLFTVPMILNIWLIIEDYNQKKITAIFVCMK